jgi:protein TonB
MNISEIKPQRWDDIVFENRNKAYGAYTIRSSYVRFLFWAIIITLLVIAFIIGYPKLAEWLSPPEVVEEKALPTTRYTDLAPPPPIDKNTPPPPKLDVPPPVKKAIKFLPPKVTEKEVQEEEKIPTQDEVKQTDPGPETVDGTGDVIFDEPVEDVVKEKSDEDVIFTVVEQPAEYSGGYEAMAKFIGKNLKYPAQARRMGVEGSVFVSFVIDKEGKISDVQIVKGIAADCDKEAARVVSLMPPWKPGKQNGRPVKSRFVLPIKFKLG